MALGLPIYSVSSLDIIKQLNPGATPQTVVIDARGTVVKNWIGAFSSDQQKEIEAYFSLKLPLIAPDTSQR